MATQRIFLPLRNPRSQIKGTSFSRNIDLLMTISIWKVLREEMAVCWTSQLVIYTASTMTVPFISRQRDFASLTPPPQSSFRSSSGRPHSHNECSILNTRSTSTIRENLTHQNISHLSSIGIRLLTGQSQHVAQPQQVASKMGFA